MDYTVSDTLVLKIEEHEASSIIDTTLYILYDVRSHRYVIRGNRRPTSSGESHPYSFESDSTSELADFIQFLICPENRVSYVLYNYDNLSDDPDCITYDFLQNNDEREYELAAYDNKKLVRKELMKNLRILKSVFNYY